jgi:hypothetical protein
MKKLKRYEVIDSYAILKPVFAVREVGNHSAAGYICNTCGHSKAERHEIERLVEQANAAFEAGKVVKS